MTPHTKTKGKIEIRSPLGPLMAIAACAPE